ncbi:MAG: 16S rRNA (cytosine(1402)-N(4))-methyltransferase, partial [Cetobacterium sp.]
MHEIESEYHIPVLYYESLETLVTKEDGIYVDCTLGGG